jgi:hypothetical protein
VKSNENTEELIKEIEAFLALTASRDLFTAGEVQDLLLDLRALAV